jgi:hypothetical protein
MIGWVTMQPTGIATPTSTPRGIGSSLCSMSVRPVVVDVGEPRNATVSNRPALGQGLLVTTGSAGVGEPVRPHLAWGICHGQYGPSPGWARSRTARTLPLRDTNGLDAHYWVCGSLIWRSSPSTWSSTARVRAHGRQCLRANVGESVRIFFRVTLSPGPLGDGIDPPVTIDSSTAVLPSCRRC